MLLAVDAGNSNIVFALWRGDAWSEPLRIETRPPRDAEGYRQVFAQWLTEQGVKAGAITQTILSSVVPAVTTPLAKAIESCTSKPPIMLSSQTPGSITIGANAPEKVGSDLIADATAAYALVQGPCITVDLGTATTIMAVDTSGVLQGGAICAGLKASAKSIVADTAQLPDIPLQVPAAAIGKNTTQCMQSGLVMGHICMVEGLIERMKNELGPAKVVATGGLISVLAPHTQRFDLVKPMLTLDGLRIIAEVR